MRRPAPLLLLLLAACNLPFEPPPEPVCGAHSAWWPDEDGDGVGEGGTVYIGCAPPAGWVDVPPADDTDTDTDTDTDSDVDTDTDTGGPAR
jgi:hypothetical protein